MSRRASREARLVRGLVVAASGAGLAVGGHLAAGGGLPSKPAVLLLVLLASAACTLLSDREWSFGRLLVALGAVELLVHLAMGLDHGAMSGAVRPGPSGWAMLGAHAAAALLSAWMLRCGEAMYWRIVERLRPRPLPRVLALRVTSELAVGASADPGPLQSLLRLTDAASRRGPPTLAA
jgi:hypothetical protein